MHFNLWEDILLYKTRVHSFKIVWVDYVMKTKEKVKEVRNTPRSLKKEDTKYVSKDDIRSKNNIPFKEMIGMKYHWWTLLI